MNQDNNFQITWELKDSEYRNKNQKLIPANNSSTFLLHSYN